VRSIAAVPRLVDALVEAGATNLSGPSFRFAHPEEVTARARTAAVGAARQQADDYARAMGMRLGRVLRVSERGIDSDERGSEVVVTGSRIQTPVQPGTQTVRVTVWVDYALNTARP
jgi:uncharacterized protein YggE